ncbi:exodeoxyribonuclease VII large subunit [Patescibacteria group bacterium]|nr:exodeoxyribonuclease VII large subunit [Patescibacteria group bacterium]
MPPNFLLEKLREWRKKTARKEGVELFRVLNNKSLEDVARLKPQDKNELISIKGIKEKKYQKYGEEILSIVNFLRSPVESEEEVGAEEQQEREETIYTVEKYLNLLNDSLSEIKGRVQGEIAEINIRSNYLFFSLKDLQSKSILRCFMWRRDYEICGIKLEEGTEIIVNGLPEVYKPSGSLTFRSQTVELVGEGALKKAYEKLKKKLEKEGLFDPAKKRILPEFPQKIGLITSSTGAVIHDFLNNLGNYGYQIKFKGSRVEGQAAVTDLVAALNYFQQADIEVLVIIRGGGSLESLQAFNNEILTRKIANFRVPVICGIGHDQDVPLASLASDLIVSTPTATAITLNQSWDEAKHQLLAWQEKIINQYQHNLMVNYHYLENKAHQLISRFNFVFEKFNLLKTKIKESFWRWEYTLKEKKNSLDRWPGSWFKLWQNNFNIRKEYLKSIENKLKDVNPLRQLKLGYSIISRKNKIIKSIQKLKKGDQVDVRLSDGQLKTKIDQIKKI